MTDGRTVPGGPEPSTRAAFVVLAGGSGTRVGAAVNKVYLPLAGRAVVSWSFEWAREVPLITRFVLVARAEDVEIATRVMAEQATGLDVDVITGGDTRHDSEQAALDRLAPLISRGELDVVALHDGARPLTGPSLVGTAVATAAAIGGAVPAVPAEGLLAVGPPDRDTAAGRRLVRVQTPQAFRAGALLDAYAAASRDGYQGTDTASSLEAYSTVRVAVVPGSRRNLKITFPHDLALAERLLVAHRYRLP